MSGAHQGSCSIKAEDGQLYSCEYAGRTLAKRGKNQDRFATTPTLLLPLPLTPTRTRTRTLTLTLALTRIASGSGSQAVHLLSASLTGIRSTEGQAHRASVTLRKRASI